MKDNKVKVWLARDKSGRLYIHPTRPRKLLQSWCSDFGYETECEVDYFPSVKWEDDEPTEAYITLAKPQEELKKGIDWEQLWFDIAKDVIITYVSKIGFDEFDNNTPEQTETTMKIIELSIKIADTLLGTLKQQSK